MLGTYLCRARTEWTFWTPLTIQYGVTVSHDSYVKCCIKTELMGCNKNTLRRGPECCKPQVCTLGSGLHQDADMSGTFTAVGYKNSELWPPNVRAWPYHGSCSEPWRTSAPLDTCPHSRGLAWDWCLILHLQALAVTRTSHPMLSLLASVTKAPLSVCNLHVTLLVY